MSLVLRTADSLSWLPRTLVSVTSSFVIVTLCLLWLPTRLCHCHHIFYRKWDECGSHVVMLHVGISSIGLSVTSSFLSSMQNVHFSLNVIGQTCEKMSPTLTVATLSTAPRCLRVVQGLKFWRVSTRNTKAQQNLYQDRFGPVSTVLTCFNIQHGFIAPPMFQASWTDFRFRRSSSRSASNALHMIACHVMYGVTDENSHSNKWQI